MVRLAESIVWPWVSQTPAALMASSSVSYGPFILTYSPYVDTQIIRCASVHQRRKACEAAPQGVAVQTCTISLGSLSHDLRSTCGLARLRHLGLSDRE